MSNSRLLRVTKSPAVSSRIHREQSKRKRRKKEPPFLLRNCIKAREEWSRYEAKMKQWASEQYEKKKRERKAARDALKAHNESSTESNCSSRGEHSSFEKSLFGAQEGGLLRSFYTIWNINRLKAQTATCEEVNNVSFCSVCDFALVFIRV
ncbi:unnamed protein product [Anisakis simplex]|uniref:Remorin_C domain-containing protein n=1 Tax=Anisakis simplex TaxID=6269 RepID=A0A0M3JIT7_ANISI|nr:unnamed protein product [Anisakis simplex]